MLTSIKNYAAFTNAAFLLRDARIVANLLLEQKSSKEINKLIIETNLLERRSEASRQTLARVLLQRLEPAPQELLSYLASGDPNLQRYTNLYLILLQHRLLREFLAELVYEHLQKLVYHVSQTELTAFFNHKELEPAIGKWSAQTYKKSQNNILKICQEAELLVQSQDGYTIRAAWVPNDLKSYLTQTGQNYYLALMLDGDA